MSTYDYVIVGSGINALVAAAVLGKKGASVLLLERNAAIGGCLRTEEITAPGFIHDVMATTLVLFRTSPAYAVIGKDLEARGFAFADSSLPTGVLRPDGSSVIFAMDRKRNVATFDSLAAGDGATFAREMDALGSDAPFLFRLLGGALWSPEHGDARGPRGLETRRAKPRRLVRRRIDACAKPSGEYLSLRRSSRALGTLGLAHRLGTGKQPILPRWPRSLRLPSRWPVVRSRSAAPVRCSAPSNA